MGKYDTAWKTYFSDEHRFADLINGVIGGGAQLVSAQQLSDLDSQVGYRTPDQAAPADPASPFKNEQRKWKKMRPKFRDMVRKVALGMNFVIVGIESQEKTHYLMPLRCMGYDVREYERQAAMEASRVKQAYEKKEISLREEEYLSLFRKDSRLMPCITLVLYFGDEWDGATSLRELLEERDVPDAFLPFINNYHVHILHVKKCRVQICSTRI